MACYDPNSLTASGTGELSVNLNATGGLAVDVNGIYVDYVACRVAKTAVQSIPNNVETLITWDTETVDTDGFHDNVTNNSRLTVPSTGTYEIVGNLFWSYGATGPTMFHIYKNGTSIYQRFYADPNISANGGVSGVWVGTATAGDYFQFYGYHNLGTARDIIVNGTYMYIRRIPGS